MSDGRSLWATKFEEKFAGGVFTVQDSIARQIADAMALQLTSEEKRLLAKRHTQSSEAYLAYLKGRYFWNLRTAEGLKKAVNYFQQAIDLDADYALAYAGLADSYILLDYYAGLSPGDVMPKAAEAAVKALSKDDALAEARTSLAYVRFRYDWDWSAAEREFKRALELSPRYATARHWHAEFLTAMGRFEEAIAESRKAQEFEPLSLIISSDAGIIFYFARQYDQAIAQYWKTLELDRSFSQARLYIGEAYEQQGRYQEAITEYQQARAISGGSAGMAALGHAFAVSGRQREARQILEELKARSRRGYIAPDAIALVYAGLGETDQAFAWLERAYAERSPGLVFLKVEPWFDSLRADVRYADLLRRLRLGP